MKLDNLPRYFYFVKSGRKTSVFTTRAEARAFRDEVKDAGKRYSFWSAKVNIDTEDTAIRA